MEIGVVDGPGYLAHGGVTVLVVEVVVGRHFALDQTSQLGRGVKIVTGKKKGRIELEYYGIDDLNDLLEALALLKVRKAQKGSKA